MVSEILEQPDAVFGNKYEIMDLFTKAVQNGDDPMIVASQINSAAYYGRNKPRSAYIVSFSPFFSLRRFLSKKKILLNTFLIFVFALDLCVSLLSI